MRCFGKIAFSVLSVVLFTSFSYADVLQPGEKTIESCLVPGPTTRALKRLRLKKPAYLYIKTEPSWAKIYINGKLSGTGTAMLTRASGSPFVKVKITASDYETIQGWLRLTPKVVLKVRAKLIKQGGGLTLLTRPAGAKVVIDGIPSGTTPVTIQHLEPGPHNVELRSDVWQWKGPLNVKAGDTQVITMEMPAAIAPPVRPKPPAPPKPAPQQKIRPVTVKKVTPPKQQVAPVRPKVKRPAPKPAARKKRPDCKRICKHFVDVSGSNLSVVTDTLHSTCMDRCNALDMPFCVCAWKAQNKANVEKCMSLPPAK